MVMFPDYFVGLTTVVGILASFALPLVSLGIKDKRVWDLYTLVVTFFLMTLTCAVFIDVFINDRVIVYRFGGFPPPLGIVYTVDKFNAIIALTTTIVCFFIALYSVEYMEKFHGVEWFYTLLLGMETGMLGVFYTGDVFNLFVMLEVTSIAAYGLVAFNRSTKEAVEAALKYSIIGATATTLYFLSLIFIYASFGTLNMGHIAFIARQPRAYVLSPLSLFATPYAPLPQLLLGAIIFIALATWVFSFKAALFPNHFWLPDAHPAAPTPISAALSGLVVKVGVYAIMRFLTTLFGVPADIGFPITFNAVKVVLAILMGLGLASVIVGGLLMTVQTDIKRLIAYSTVLHIGIITVAFSTFNIVGVTASIYHIINHSFAKALLFMAAGAFIHRLGTRSIDELAGAGRYMKISLSAMLIAILTLVGLPPFATFTTILLLYSALLELGLAPLIVIIIFGEALAFIGYIRIIYGLWFKPPVKDLSGLKEVGAPMKITFIVMSVIVVLIGVLAPILVSKVIYPVANSLMDATAYIDAVEKAAREVISALMGG